ncbi:50S ribosomal protein L30 [Candidatus Bathyarchaeota archaeon]|nr:MAG: 50S ribosomal protein L30 [Candidatus Bathyarchaeota archaeon]
MSSEKTKCIVAVRIRGVIGASQEIKDTLKMLNLKRNNHAVIVKNTPAYLGMLRKVQNYITWGEPTQETVISLIKKWGRLVGDKKITDEYAKKLGFKSVEDLAKAVFEGKVDYNKLPDVKPFFRLHPPTKGFKGKIKKSYGMGGETGYRGRAINELIQRMI